MIEKISFGTSLHRQKMNRQKQPMQGLILLMMAALLSACGTSVIKPSKSKAPDQKQSESRYTLKQDKAPAQHRDMSNTPDAVPRLEPHSRGGNKSTYEVWGKQYYVLPSSQGFREEGIASWYGEKFHGHLTSNGEIYDMFAMTAAHKHLPLPTYARVINLENNRVVIVRVNDRGPFHGNRTIDLSYAAASKLGYHKKGVAKVLVEAIDASQWSPAIEQNLRNQRQLVGTQQIVATNVNIIKPAVAEPTQIKLTVPKNEGRQITEQAQRPRGYFVQLGAFGKLPSAINLADRVSDQLVRADIQVERSLNGQLYRVLIGPIRDDKSTQVIRQQVVALGYGNAIVLKP